MFPNPAGENTSVLKSSQKTQEGAVKKHSGSMKNVTHPHLPSENYSADQSAKFKGRKKKYKGAKGVEGAVHASSESPKASIKYSSNATSDMSSDLLSKINSSDNMRKNYNKDRRASVPNNPLELKDACQVASKCLPQAENTKKLDKKPSKYRSKTPDNKGASGKTSTKKGSFKKSTKFEPYIPLFQVQQGLKRGEFIEGALRINPRNYEDAYVNSPDGKMDIYIGGMHDRNRALNGDIVVVQINPKQEWKVLCDAIKDYQEKCGESVVETVIEPVTPTTPCKVHTPDKFMRSRPVSSNSWDSMCGERLPDSLEILGIDRLAKQIETISVKQKISAKSRAKRKSKSEKYGKESSSQKSSNASYSQESSEDCLDKMPPGDSYNMHKNGDISNMVAGNGNSTSVVNKNTGESSFFSNGSSAQAYPPCNMSEIGTFEALTESHQDTCKSWEGCEPSYNITVSPEQLLNIDDDLVDVDSDLFQSLNVDKKDDDSSSGIDGIVVAPEDLSGDEFTDSASVGSSCSQNLDQVLEDVAFFACQQDAENNNVQFISEQQQGNLIRNFSSNDYSHFVTSQPVVSKEKSLEFECRMQHNQAMSPLASFDINSESVICSAVSEIAFLKDNLSSSDENVVNPLIANECQAVPNLKFMEQSNVIQNGIKKSRHRKKRKKHSREKDCKAKSVNEVKNISLDIDSLTVEEVMKHPEWPRFIQKTGKVVHILERKHSCLAAGHLKLCSDKNPKWALFSPNDSRVPRIMVPMSDCPQNFYHRPSDYSEVLFLAEITQWNETSTFAAGRLVRSLGNTGDIEAETDGLLFEKAVDFEEFTSEVLNCLPQNPQWDIPLEELNYRRDFRRECVFTIDPATARDMDDAVSCTVLDNGNFEVGVHIADVTYFVKEGTALDDAAKCRATSVYLVQKVIPMLPRKLCDDLCSLTAGKDRLTYSVSWEMSPDGKVLSQWIGRSVINSCIKLSYEHAQDMIENPTRVWNEFEHPEIFGGFIIYDVIKRVNQLHSLAVKLREKRFLEGALKLDQVKLEFTLNSETGLPSGFNVFVQKDSNRLIEEFMLLANMSVATKIYKSFPSLALLRRHPPPQSKPMADIVSLCETMGVILDTSSSGALQSSISRYAGDDYSSSARSQVLMNLCAKPMNCALYFCAGIVDDPSYYHHYALNVPLYTHFTSPIRRYPDIIVHRLLSASLQLDSLLNLDPAEMQKCAVHCNDKKYNAKRASELSAELFLAAFIRELGSINASGIVVGVLTHSFDCLILNMGIVKRVYCDKLPLVKKEYKKYHGVPVLNLTWKDTTGIGAQQVIVMFAMVNVTLTVEKDALQIKVILRKPEI